MVPVSTTLGTSPTHVELSEPEGSLDQASMAKCEQISTLDKSYSIRRLFSGTISLLKMTEMKKAIQ